MTHKVSNNLLHHFERYRSIIDDWDHFAEMAQRPLPTCIWTNTLKTTPERLARRLPLEPISWHPGAFRCPPDLNPSQEIPFLAGHYLRQEEAAMLPIALLDPQPSDLVLDLCAAPGNKTAQAAVRMASRGRLIANDRSRARLGILRRIINRLGLTNVAITAYDATSYTAPRDAFDKVLADVPCSGEGTLRRYSTSFSRLSDRRLERLRNTQAAILKRAIALCRPGGLIVYATCTFAPEENEGIVDRALREMPDKADLEPIHIPGLVLSPGLPSWKDTVYVDGIQKTARLWPHQNDTGGFFVALLRKKGEDGSAAILGETHLGKPEYDEEANQFLRYLAHRFNICAEDFQPLHVLNEDRYLYLSDFEKLPAGLPPFLQIGLPLAQLGKKLPKLKTGAAMLLAPHASRHILQLDAAQTMQYARLDTFPLDTNQVRQGTSSGYVLLQYEDLHLGLGLLRKRDGAWLLESVLPKHWMHALAD